MMLEMCFFNSKAEKKRCEHDIDTKVEACGCFGSHKIHAKTLKFTSCEKRNTFYF